MFCQARDILENSIDVCIRVRCRLLNNCFLTWWLKREYQLAEAIDITIRNHYIWFILKDELEIPWCSGLVICCRCKWDSRRNIIFQLIYASVRNRNNRCGFKELSFYVDVCPFKDYVLWFVICVTYYLGILKSFDNRRWVLNIQGKLTVFCKRGEVKGSISCSKNI